MLSIEKNRRAAFLVDGSNIYATAKALGFQIDYKKLTDSFDGALFKAYYFTALRPEGEDSAVKPLVDHLVYNGWTTVTKPTSEWVQADGRTKIKGNMDIEIAVIAKEIAPYVTDIFLFSGDGDFTFLVDALQRAHLTTVHVVSTIKSDPPMCADRLRRQADIFIDLADMRTTIERKDGDKSPSRRVFRSVP
jgi:uncharacterized LabA/DUF88 family protein